MKVRLQPVGRARRVPVVAVTVMTVTVLTVLLAHYSRFVCTLFITHMGYARMLIHSQNSGSGNRAPRGLSATRTGCGLIACGH
jgi:sterol desaturase/sphingolipid hydroxylase (fatty acid hydroxylase superfamily)